MRYLIEQVKLDKDHPQWPNELVFKIFGAIGIICAILSIIGTYVNGPSTEIQVTGWGCCIMWTLISLINFEKIK